MGIESATYISDLVPSNPVNTDLADTAANHIRLIKQVLQDTFPNLVGACTGLSNYGGFTPIGGIIIWSGASTAIPSGWHLCDGTTGITRSDGGGTITAPNLMDSFVIGAGNTYTVGQTGGATSQTPTITVAGHSISQTELPNYNLPVTDNGHGHGVNDNGHAHQEPFCPTSTANLQYGSGPEVGINVSTNGTFPAETNITIYNSTANISVNSGGSGSAHTHTATSSAVPTLPPYYALCYIMKT